MSPLHRLRINLRYRPNWRWIVPDLKHDFKRWRLERSRNSVLKRLPPFWHDDERLHPPVGTWMWHIHHTLIGEELTEPLANRLSFIKQYKPVNEIETRLRLIDPIQNMPPNDIPRLSSGQEAIWLERMEVLHAIQHPDCPWDGWTIFPAAPE